MKFRFSTVAVSLALALGAGTLRAGETKDLDLEVRQVVLDEVAEAWITWLKASNAGDEKAEEKAGLVLKKVGLDFFRDDVFPQIRKQYPHLPEDASIRGAVPFNPKLSTPSVTFIIQAKGAKKTDAFLASVQIDMKMKRGKVDEYSASITLFSRK